MTGLGAISPLGVGADTLWSEILAKRCGIAKLQDPVFQNLPTTIAGVVPPTFVEVNYLNSNEKRSANRTTCFAMVAADEALQQSGLNEHEKLNKEKVGVCFGSSLAGFNETIDIARSVDETAVKGYRRVSPFFIPRILDNMAAGTIAMKYGFTGPNHSSGTACTTGAHSIGDAFNLLRLGMADVIVAGSGEACIHPLAMAAFCQAKALCTNSNDSPLSSSRPFDEARAGFVMSEGCGVMVLEDLEHAVNRDANILAEVVGYGMSADAHHITAPCPAGLGAMAAMKGALKNVSKKHKVGYINAHATSTPLGDMAEAEAIRTVFKIDGDNKGPYVSSTKGSTGHLLGGAGSVEAIISVQSLVHRTVPQTLNLENPCCELKHVTEPVSDLDLEYVLTNSFGFGGTNAALCFKRINLQANVFKIR